MNTFLQIFLSTFLLSNPILDSFGQNSNPPRLEEATEITYKTVDEIKLNLWIYYPTNHQESDKKPAIVFFFGGGWRSGSPDHFRKHCEYLANRGMVAIVADYRVAERHNVLANKCVSDAKSSIRWVREHASELGVDPNRIAAGGGSAGGHLAAATAMLPDFDEPSEDIGISSKPNALVLFNPALVLAPVEGQYPISEEELKTLELRLGAKAVSMSPFHHIKTDMPPAIIFHGTDDTTVPFITAQLFTEKMKQLGNKCKLVGYQGESHGFFNFGKKGNGPFIDSVNKMDNFLVSIGYLEAPPETNITN